MKTADILRQIAVRALKKNVMMRVNPEVVLAALEETETRIRKKQRWLEKQAKKLQALQEEVEGL